MLFSKNIIISEINAFVADFRRDGEMRINPRPYHSLTFRLSGRIRLSADGVELISDAGCVTYVPRGTEYVTGKTFTVNADQNRFLIFYISANQSQMFGVVGF